MTKEQLVELVSKRVEAIDKGNRLHPETVAKYITMAFSQLFTSTFIKTRRDLDVYTKQYELTVEDGFAPFTVSLYQLPFMAQVRGIADISDRTRRYVPVDVSGPSLYDNLDVGLIDDSVSYSITPTGLQFYDLPDAITQVRAWLVPTFDSLDDDDDVHIPASRDLDFFQVIDQIVMSKRPSDLKNDNASWQSTQKA
jgi:hypothetical protein